ncbi:hypothetical protein ROS217_08795 [Roseovarius sp. 217]|nr:hypothetical protein ROS217_08795 [Roseovarius sp. 217]
MGETKAKNAYHTSRYAAHATNQIEQSCLISDLSNFSKCVAEIINSTNEDQRAQDDLEAQTEMALWAFWMLVATVIVALITGLGVIFVWQTLKATQRMATDTREIGQAQTRAYLSITGAKYFRNGRPGREGHNYVRLTIHNSGNSPARNVNLRVTDVRVEADISVDLFSKPKQIGDIASGDKKNVDILFAEPFEVKGYVSFTVYVCISSKTVFKNDGVIREFGSVNHRVKTINRENMAVVPIFQITNGNRNA